MRRQAQQLAHVRLRSTDPPITVTARLSDQRPNVDSGYGGWTEVARPRKTPLAVWAGATALRVSIPLLLDGWRAGDSVEDEISKLEKMATATASDGQPPRVRFTARGSAVPHQGRVWVIDNLTWGDALMNAKGNRVRQQVTVSLLEYVTDVQVHADSAATRQRAKSASKKTKSGAASKRVVAAAKPPPVQWGGVWNPPTVGSRKVKINFLADPGFDEWDGTMTGPVSAGDGSQYLTGGLWMGYPNYETLTPDREVAVSGQSVKVVMTQASAPGGILSWDESLRLTPGAAYVARVWILAQPGSKTYMWTGQYDPDTYAVLDQIFTRPVWDGTWQLIEQPLVGTATPSLPTVGVYIDASDGTPWEVGDGFNVDSAELVYADAVPVAPAGGGEDLLSIAARELGDADRWVEIAQLNGIRDPRTVVVGQVLRLP